VLVAFMTRLDADASISGASLVTLMTLSQSLVDFITFYAIMETSIGAVTRVRTLAQSIE
jgi:ATP-binding cassette subfamily C (CFTR/MRP) protein 1